MMALINSCQLCTSRTSGTFTVVCGTPLSLDSQYFVIYQLVLYQLTMITVNSIVTFPWLFRGFILCLLYRRFWLKRLNFWGIQSCYADTKRTFPERNCSGAFLWSHIIPQSFSGRAVPGRKDRKVPEMVQKLSTYYLRCGSRTFGLRYSDNFGAGLRCRLRLISR